MLPNEPKKVHRTKLSTRGSGKKREPKVVDFVKNPSFTDDANLLIFKDLEAKAHGAINGKRIFSVVGGFEVIRQSMLARGWIEKILDFPTNKNTVDEKVISETTGCLDTRRMVLSHLVKQSPVYFIWQPKHFDGISININFPYRNRINRLRTSDYTLKEGLHNLAENIQWHIIEDVSELNYPRSFLLMDLYQREFFLIEYRRTMITSFLFYLNDYEHFDRLFSESAVIPIDLIYNCIHRIEYYIKMKQHLCIDLDKAATNLAYSEMAKQIDLVVNQRKKIRFPEYNHNFSMDKLRTNIKVAVAEIHVYWPESKYDGHRNIWILKPINKSRGIGVVLMKEVEKIFDHVIRHTENKYIIQKYCELPLLVHHTKFDTRQYFLTVITRGSVNIWCYRDCYIKFSSQEFSLDNLHESIHLTNNSIQRFYNNGYRHEALPSHNMWLLKEFQSYLQMINKAEIWNEKIYPRIKANLLAVIMASLEDTDLEMNTFELNGADFLIGYDFDPILLEINANPDLTFTTCTTRDICPRVMEDLIKVIIDLPADPSISTGEFELIHECPIGRYFPSQKIQLNVDGKKILPPTKPVRNFFHLKNFSELMVRGEKLFKPIKSRYRNQRVPMEMKNIKAESLMTDEEQKAQNEKKIFKRIIKPRKIYRSPTRPRNMFKTIVVKPSAYSTDISSYVRNLPSILQSTNRKFSNLSDLMRYLNLNENVL